jgi:alpha-maltose-1-phosphate synthase
LRTVPRQLKALLAHPGTQYSFRLALELERRESLSAFHTGFAFCADGLTDKAWRALPLNLRRGIANRRIEGLPRSQLHCHPLDELHALVRLRNGADPQLVMHRRNEKFQRGIPDEAIASAEAVIGFDTSSWILAERCKEKNIPFVLDQSTCHPDAKIAAHKMLQLRFPHWNGTTDIRNPQVRKAEDEEHKSASMLVVASSFTRRTLIENGVPPAKVRVNPYGVDCTSFLIGERSTVRPFRFIFVGGVNASKGAPLLLEAWQQLNAIDAELWIVGPTSRQVRALLSDVRRLRYFGAVPQSELSAILQQCDVFVFPSLFEGFGQVILEAMACGLPVLTTTATAGQDVISSGQDGWVIEPGDVERMTQIMGECLSSRDSVHEMGRSARVTAERFTWAEYGRRWLEILAAAE